MRYFLSTVARGIQTRANRKNHVFGTRYGWSLLDSSYALACCYKYVFRNPVRAGICQGVEDYPFSSLNSPLPSLTAEGFDNYWRLIPKDRIERLDWMNQTTPREIEALIARALRRKTFRFSTESNLQKSLRELKKSYVLDPLGE